MAKTQGTTDEIKCNYSVEEPDLWFATERFVACEIQICYLREDTVLLKRLEVLQIFVRDMGGAFRLIGIGGHCKIDGQKFQVVTKKF